ncbi:hypothetical protein HanXRQr2_Chr09g0407671 [Helianthus annuus]|uniref:Uncharacterized protein n=1 Tax=Helianthus annuus TaxID=4232 RepID=A0A9K3NA28_HELAN|nr:hypothetical protein HanXRQr2_Chr09g0407671 [Helianthus annuus]KAJ0894845.1 hypothetical protein HanPSC8_Chr09g0393551 [Helianthus annuus]
MCKRVYLKRRCKQPRESRALVTYVKYILVPTPGRIFSTKLDVAKSTPNPCTNNTGEKTTGRGTSLAAAGLPSKCIQRRI